MLSDILKLGDKIDVKHMDRLGRPARNAKTYVSQLMDFIDFDVIHIATPIAGSVPVILNVGENYNLCFYSNKGLYQCNCTILKNIRENNIMIAVVRITTNLEKFQRRQFYRLEYMLDVKFHLITREEETLSNRLKANEFQSEEEAEACKLKLSQLEEHWSSAILKDISGGGTRFTTEEALNKDNRIRLNLNLEFDKGMKNLRLEAVVIMADKVMNKSGLYEYRVEYTDIMKGDREDLIRYIFEQERKRR